MFHQNKISEDFKWIVSDQLWIKMSAIVWERKEGVIIGFTTAISGIFIEKEIESLTIVTWKIIWILNLFQRPGKKTWKKPNKNLPVDIFKIIQTLTLKLLPFIFYYTHNHRKIFEKLFLQMEFSSSSPSTMSKFWRPLKRSPNQYYKYLKSNWVLSTAAYNHSRRCLQ